MIKATFNSLGYANSTVFEPPVIGSSNNGWVYKPDLMRTPQEIKRGINKSFPRDSGPEDARKWLQQHIDEHFSLRNWERPISVDKPVTSVESGRGNTLTVAWQDSVFGWVSVECVVYQKGTDRHRAKYYPDDDVNAITLKVNMHSVLKYLVTHDTEGAASSWGNYEHTDSISTKVDAADIPRFVNEWMADPWTVTCDRFTKKTPRMWTGGDSGARSTEGQQLSRYLPTPPSREAFNTADYKADRAGYADEVGANEAGVWSTSNDNALFYKKGVIEKIMESDVNWEAITELTTALQFTGYELSIKKDHLPTNWNKEYISGFTIKIPEQGNTHAHTIKVNASNPHVTVECGFERDEARWVDSEKRKAVQRMNELEEDLRTFEIDLGEEGVE